MGGTLSTPTEEPATNGHAEEAVQAATEPLLGHHPSKPFDLRTTFSAPLAILTGVFLALFFVFVRQAVPCVFIPLNWSVGSQSLVVTWMSASPDISDGPALPPL